MADLKKTIEAEGRRAVVAIPPDDRHWFSPLVRTNFLTAAMARVSRKKAAPVLGSATPGPPQERNQGSCKNEITLPFGAPFNFDKAKEKFVGLRTCFGGRIETICRRAG